MLPPTVFGNCAFDGVFHGGVWRVQTRPKSFLSILFDVNIEPCCERRGCHPGQR